MLFYQISVCMSILEGKMKYPTTGCPNSKTKTSSKLNNSSTNKKEEMEEFGKESEKCHKEIMAPVNCFDTLANGANNLGSQTINADKPQFQIRQPDVESDTESTDSDGENNEYTSKGPEFPTKQNKELRKNTPYEYSLENNSINHYCGGTILFDQGHTFDNYQVPLPTFTEQENEDLDLIIDMITKSTNMLPPEEKQRFDAAINNALNEDEIMINYDKPVEPFDYILSQETVTSRDINQTRSSVDEDSAYETSSPHSSISNSPMPNSLFVCEGSPCSEPPITLNIPFTLDGTDSRSSNHCAPNFKVPSPRQVERREKTQPLTIQQCPTFRIPSPSLNIIASPRTQRRPNIAPASTVVVHEEQMKETAEARIKKHLNPNVLYSQWKVASCDANFYQINNGLTKLMAHLKFPVDAKHFYEVFAAQMSILTHGSENNEVDKCLSFLRYTNQKSESALTIAIKEYTDRPLVARHILETLFTLYDNDPAKARAAEPLLLHRLIKEGDRMAHILAECLNMSLGKNSSKRCFDVNEKDSSGLTPLLLATSLHNSHNKEPNFSTSAITNLLVKHGASVSIGDLFGLTPIDYVVKESCDPLMLKTLLSHTDVIERKAVDLEDHMKNTALHIAAKRHDVPIDIQANVMKQLKDSGWNMTKSNIENKTPQSLLPEDRKQWILEYINRKK